MQILSSDLQLKHQNMEHILRDLGSVAVAFSGGVDSTLVLKVALDVLGSGKVVAVTGVSNSLARHDLSEARALARRLGAEHVLLDTDEFDNESYLSNPMNRCYYCKTTLYATMTDFIRARALHAIVNGVNCDDLGDFRPGLRAGVEHGVFSPAADAGLTKADVRDLSAHLALPTADKPASPCLSSRVPYGERITPEKLQRIEAAEAYIREEVGIRACRVRHHGMLARIEVPLQELERLAAEPWRSRLESHLLGLGFRYVTLDIGGLRSGSLNDLVQVRVTIPS